MFECHITIDPVPAATPRRWLAEGIADTFGFRLAKLIMLKEGIEVESTKDTFMTSHSPIYAILETNMKLCISSLLAAGFVVRRYKIEEIKLDSKYQNDPLGLL